MSVRRKTIRRVTVLLVIVAIGAAMGIELHHQRQRLRNARRWDDAQSLRAEAEKLENLGNYRDALAISQRINEAAPTDLRQQIRTYELMRRLDCPPGELLDRAQKQYAAHPGDPRFELL